MSIYAATTASDPLADIREMSGVAAMKRLLPIPLLLLTCASVSPQEKTPDYSGAEHWPAGIAYSKLKDAGLVSPDIVDFKRVVSRTTASQKIGKNLWRQVFRVSFPLKSGGSVLAIVFSDASAEECSMADPQVFVISKVL